MIAEFISPQDIRWLHFLKRVPHDIYHLPEYVELAARHEDKTPIAFYAETDHAAFLAPLLMRNLPADLGAPTDWQDAISPYGYPTPLLVPAGDTESLGLFLDAFRQASAQHHLVTAFFRLHPLISLPQSALEQHGQLVLHGQTVSIDLSLSPPEIKSQTRENHRRDIRKLKKAGFEAAIDRWELLPEFISIYRQTMSRHDADQFYFFNDDYFLDMQRRLNGHLHLCTVCAPDNTVSAAGIFTSVNGIVQYHLGGTNADYLRRAPSKLMFDHVRTWASEAGNRIFHLGGGVGSREDALFKFKTGFSKLTNPFYTYQMVLDQEKYATLNQRVPGQTSDQGEEIRFFPEYRHR